MDVEMPVMTGLEACWRLKTHLVTCDIPVMLISGRDDLDDAAQKIVKAVKGA